MADSGSPVRRPVQLIEIDVDLMEYRCYFGIVIGLPVQAHGVKSAPQ